MTARAPLARWAAAAALSLAACQVEVDGAPCTTPGAISECPGGQACGNDLRCSARALACAASRCTPGVGGACLDPSGAATGTAVARWCTGADPVCGAWAEERCAERGHACGSRSGAARCQCPDPEARELTVRPDGAPVDALPFATGAASPPGCAFRTLTDALAAAEVLHALDPSSAVTVTASGASAGATTTFSAATGERFPLHVSRGVALRADRTGGGTSEILLDGSSATTAVGVTLRSGSTLEGFTVRNVNRGPSLAAISVACAAGDDRPVRLSGVRVEGRGDSGQRLGTGVHVAGPCSVYAAGLDVREAAREGLLLESGGSATVEVTAGSIAASGGSGIVVRSGGLVLDGVRVAENAGRGLDATAGGARVELRDCSVSWNGDTGIALTDATAIKVTRTTVFKNLAATGWGSFSGSGRLGGGIMLAGAVPPVSLALQGNRIYANGGDQLLVYAAGGFWDLNNSGSCADANLLGCYDPSVAAGGISFRGILVASGEVGAKDQHWWPWASPSADLDYWPAGLHVTTRCASPPPLDCGSELPPPPP